MKCYCLGVAIKLINKSPSGRFFNGSGAVDMPRVGKKIPVSEASVQDAFLMSEDLVLCKTFDAAMALRQNKIECSPGALGLLDDYAIYEIEIDAEIDLTFDRLLDAPIDQLEHLVSSNLYHTAAIFNDRSKILDIEICLVKKKAIQPKLVACHFLSPYQQEELVISSHRCLIL